MKYGIAIGDRVLPNKPYFFGGKIGDCIRKAYECGFKAVEIHMGDPKGFSCKNLLHFCNKYEMNVSAISTGFSYYDDKLSLTDDDIEVRNSAIKRMKDYIDLSSIIGGCIIIGNMRGSVPAGLSTKIITDRLAESVKKICDYANRKNVTIVIEATNRYESNYLNNAKELRDFIENYDIPELRIHLDTFHMNIEEKNPAESIREAKDLLGYFHISDNNRMYPGTGHIDFKSVASALKDINYNGYIVAECLPIPDGETAAKRTLDYVKSIVDLVKE